MGLCVIEQSKNANVCLVNAPKYIWRGSLYALSHSDSLAAKGSLLLECRERRGSLGRKGEDGAYFYKGGSRRRGKGRG